MIPMLHAEEAGSSPLARGLPPVDPGAEGGGGIIPARAGFTERYPLGRPARADHPRSRGVYAAPILAALSEVGSSPLARGLLPPEAERDDGGGIIPARAGFTHHRIEDPIQ